MTDIIITSDLTVEYISGWGTDETILHAARISTQKDQVELVEDGELEGLINYLTKHRHGTPFEHNSVCFRVHAPICVFREWQRHRVPFSYNEESARYSQLAPVFYVPPRHRPLVNVGTSARPKMEAGDDYQYMDLIQRLTGAYEFTYAAYEASLADNIAKEVSRLTLPVGIYSSMYVTANLRGWLNFLSLRTHDEDATYVSYPQWEIEQCARQVEAELTSLFPVTLEAWRANGRVAP